MVLEWNGYWWDPKSPADRWPGVLSFDQEEGAVLRVTTTQSLVEVQRELRVYPMIHGEATAVRELTLIDCFERSVKGSFRGPSSREVYANRVIAGMQVPGPDPLIRSASAVFSNLNTWLWETGFDVDASFEQPFSFAVRYVEPEPIRAFESPELTVRLSPTLTTLPIRPDSDGSMLLKQKVFVQFEATTPRPLSFFQNRIRAFQDFLSMASLTFCGVEEERLCDFEDGASPDQYRTAHFYGIPVLSPPKNRSLRPQDMLFSFQDVAERFQQVLTRWFTVADALEPVRALYMSALYGNHYLNVRFLFLAQALEVLHRRLFDGTYVSEDSFKGTIFPQLIANLPHELGPDLRGALTDRLKFGNEYSLRKRLKLLVAKYDRTLSAFIPQVDELVTTVVELRNYFTHYTSAQTTPGADLISSSTDFLRVVVELSILEEVGFSGDEIHELATRSQTYKRRFQG